ncbi:MAG: nucleoside triphosphate pyrophosphohydrolase [Lentisphaeria bacterium]|nr:nucleoside triphosphate pyrophosphohydrolase [Lentisphaeria bacterium]
MNMSELERLVNVMRRLRAPDGCPWDREQTHESLKKCLVGEAAEYLDAVDHKSDAEMCEELGDLLMQVVMNSIMAEERGAFTLEDVARGISDKMIRRHPHVFGDVHVDNSAQVLVNWEKIKKTEHDDYRKSALDGVPHNLPAVLRAEKLQKKAAKHGFDWTNDADILAKVREEMAELEDAYRTGDRDRIDDEAADLVFAVVNFLRFRGENCEAVVNRASDKFDRRYRAVEAKLAAEGKEVDGTPMERLDELWNEAKAEENGKCPRPVTEHGTE